MTTPHGLDVVPAVSGGLAARALDARAFGRGVLVAHPADLIVTLRSHLAKHAPRVAPLERAAAGARRTCRAGGSVPGACPAPLPLSERTPPNPP